MGDAAALPIQALVAKFRDELEQAVERDERDEERSP